METKEYDYWLATISLRILNWVKKCLETKSVCIPDSPFSLRGEGLGLIVGGGGGDDLVTVLVDSSRLCGCELRLLFSLLLNLGNLLALLWRSRDFHTQDDVTDLRLSQRGHVHTGWRQRKHWLLHASLILFCSIEVTESNITVFTWDKYSAHELNLTCSFCRNLPEWDLWAALPPWSTPRRWAWARCDEAQWWSSCQVSGSPWRGHCWHGALWGSGWVGRRPRDGANTNSLHRE